MAVVARAPRKKTTRPRPARRAALEPRMRLDVDERRLQLIELGLEHFGERAYDDVSIDAIAAAAGISKGLLYHYFPTKRAYYAATIREAATRLVASTETAENAAPVDRLHAGIDAYLGYVMQHAKAYATLMRSGVVDPELAAIVDETRRTFIDRLIAGFAQGEVLGPDASGYASGLLELPVIRLSLRGWVGFAEAASLGWTEAIAAGQPAPSQREVRDLLAKALIQIVQTALTLIAKA